jgi:type IV secretory pathway TraG/TraD family ATPase VirD4
MTAPGRGMDVAVPVAAGLVWAAGGTVWAGGTLASAVTGNGLHAPSLTVDNAAALVRQGPAALWPRVPSWAVLACTLLVAALVAAIVVQVVRRVRPWLRDQGSRASLAALARAGDLPRLTPRGAAAEARKLRPTLRGVKRPDPADTGLALGQVDGVTLRASWEDVVLAVMAPRSGKTTSLAVPIIVAAPGAVVATSNKADLPAAVAGVRAEHGTVWTFDPQRIAYTPQRFVWNPLAGVTTVEEAHRLAGHFVVGVESTGDKFWSAAATDLLTSLLLAAGVTGGTLREVYTWLSDPTGREPIDRLEAAGHLDAARGLAARANGADKTRDGIYETARTAAQCLRDPGIMAWVTPREDLPTFDPSAFALTRDTVCLLSKDEAGSAAPLVAALTDRVMREATRTAERTPTGRLDPPLVMVLDEAANVCRIGDLPELYSHLGSRGIVPVTILQSVKQGARVWGRDGMDALWSAATVKVLGAGLDDPQLAEDVSRLVGDHDVPARSTSRGDGRQSESLSLRRQRILGAEQVRALPKGTALLLCTGHRIAHIRLLPWYQGPLAARVTADVQAAGARLAERASS